MDEVVMLQWVDYVFRPYILEVPSNVVPLLISDSYTCHLMVSVIMRIIELGVAVQVGALACASL